MSIFLTNKLVSKNIPHPQKYNSGKSPGYVTVASQEDPCFSDRNAYAWKPVKATLRRLYSVHTLSSWDILYAVICGLPSSVTDVKT